MLLKAAVFGLQNIESILKPFRVVSFILLDYGFLLMIWSDAEISYKYLIDDNFVAHLEGKL